MPKSINLIYYAAGCYGTFVEWLCTYFLGEETELPFTNTGSSHNFHGNFLFPQPELDKFISSLSDIKFARCHPNLFKPINLTSYFNSSSYYDICVKDLSFIETRFAKTLVLYPTVSSALWVENNYDQKCVITEEDFDLFFTPLGYNKNFYQSLFLSGDEKIRYALKNEVDLKCTLMWGKNSVDDLDKWELRELMSYYWFDRKSDYLTCWDKLAQTYANIKFMPMDLLKNNPTKFFTECLNYLGVFPDQEKLSQIIKQWLPKQEHIYKDELVHKIVNSVLTKEDYNWDNQSLTMLDEAFIQKLLGDNNIKIKCYNLDKFPTNTKDFLTLLE